MTRSDYDRLHRRCMNQRRELKRLNRKLDSYRSHMVELAADHSDRARQQWSLEIHHRNNELQRKLREAEAKIAALTGNSEAAE